jgi:hypothetical protein
MMTMKRLTQDVGTSDLMQHKSCDGETGTEEIRGQFETTMLPRGAEIRRNLRVSSDVGIHVTQCDY